jgi:amino acid permease
VININQTIITSIYIVIGVFGYLSYGYTTKPDILSNLALEKGFLAKIANITMIILMICHYPIPVYSLRKSIENFAFKTENFDKKWISFCISAAIVIIASVIGIFLHTIDTVLGFTSSLAGGTLSFIIPGMFNWKLGVMYKNKSEIVKGIIMTVSGILITGFGFGMAIY